MKERRRFSAEDRTRMLSLAAKGVPHKVIAERLGRSHACITSMLFHIRNGIYNGNRSDSVEQTERMIEMHRSGITVAEIAVIYGLRRNNVATRMAYRGYDGVLRRKARSEFIRTVVVSVSDGASSLPAGF